MPQYLAPDVYVEEVDTGSKPIEGVSTSIAGVVGVTERGPLDVPILVTSNGEFAYWFGGKLDPEDFAAHCFLPHAVEGFFTNGGKQLYVTRVLDRELASAAQAEVFDRTSPANAANTVLLRAAPESTGTAANPPPLVVLSGEHIDDGDSLRIGDGSNAEYRTVSGAPVAENVMIPLHLPLGHSHDSGAAVLQFDRVALSAPIALSADAAAGARALDVEGAIADIATLAAGNALIEIGGANGEYRFVSAVSGVAFSSATQQRAHVTLDAPLALDWPKASATLLVLLTGSSASSGGAFALTAPLAAAGATVLHVDGVAADIDALAAGDVIEISEVGTESRRISAVAPTAVSSPGHKKTDVTLASPLAGTYTLAAVLQRFVSPAPGAPIAASVSPSVRAGASLLFVADRGADFVDRTKLVLLDAALATQEVRRIGKMYTVTLSSPTEAAYDAGSPVQVIDLGDDDRVTVNAVGNPGDSELKVSDTASWHALQDILIGPSDGPYEIQTIAAIKTPGAPGTLKLKGMLATTHPTTDVVIARRALSADAQAGNAFVTLTDRSGLASGDVLHLVDGAKEELVEILALPLPAPPGAWPDGGNVVLSAPLLNGYAAATAQVTRQNTPAVDTAFHASALAIAPGAGASTLLIADADGWLVNKVPPDPAHGRFIRVRTSDGTYFHRITQLGDSAANPPVPVAAKLVTLANPALVRSHPVGSPVIERKSLFEVAALDPGAWGNRLYVAVEDEPTGLVSSTQFLSVTNATRARVASVAGMEPGTVLELVQNDGSVLGAPVKVATVSRASGEVTFDATHALSAAQQGAAPNLKIRSREIRLSVFLYGVPDPSAPTRAEPALPAEVFRNLSMDVRHSHYFEATIGRIDGPQRLSDHRPEGASWYVRVADGASTPAALQELRLGPETLVDVLPNGSTRPARQQLAGGDDSIATLSDTDYVGQDAIDPENRSGMFTLLNVEDISLIAAPGRTSGAIQQALIDQCENNRFRFCVLDGPAPPKDTITDVQFQRQQFDTKYAALYHPWLLIPNPFPGTPGAPGDYAIPPSGHMLGVYARTDIERGVHKAPANEVVNGISGLQRIVNKEQQEVLNPYPVNINVIRDFRSHSRGIRVYGGRVITSDSDWKYVNVRRLLIFIEASLNQGLQYVVFEPNAEPLWARVRRSVSNFLTLVWRNGALEGTKPEEAFFVKCDQTTMTETDREEGRLIVLIGVAPVKPAEFVIVRIGLWTASADQ